MKHTRDITMKINILWPFLSEKVVCFLLLSISFFEDQDKKCPLRNVKQFLKCSFGEICSQRLTRSAYIWN